ncbi:PadR family transcriptional regulator, partial [Geobacillus sp. 47C-IIb]
AIPALKERLKKNKTLIDQLKQTPVHVNQTGVNLAVEHKITMLEAEISFLEKTIQSLLYSN